MTMLVRVAIAALLALGCTVPTVDAESTFSDIQVSSTRASCGSPSWLEMPRP